VRPPPASVHARFSQSSGSTSQRIARPRFDAARPRLAPDFEIHPLYLERSYKGVEGMRKIWADLDEIWQDYRLEIGEIVDLGEHVLTLAHVTAHGTGSGVPVDEEIAILWAFEGDKVVWMKTFMSKREALEAAGLRE
jgi:hypothetical protein